MASCRRSITARAKLFYDHQLQLHRTAPSFSHIHRTDDTDRKELQPTSRIANVSQQHLFVNTFNSSTKTLLPDRRFAFPMNCGSAFTRNFSSRSFGETAADKIPFFPDVFSGRSLFEVLADRTKNLTDALVYKSAELAPDVSEVAFAASGSLYPIAMFQFFIDHVHCFTGFNWWASIIIATLLIRTLQIPVMISQLKATSKFTLLGPKFEAIREKMKKQSNNPNAVAEGQARMRALFKEHGVSPLTPLKGMFISGPIYASFFFAISKMAEKIPSFKDGGLLWFTDLSTPDILYILPILTALTYWISFNAQEGLEGNPNAGTIKNVSRVFAALSIVMIASMPKALFCYFITSGLFSLSYGLAIKKPGVRKILGIPPMASSPTPTTNQNPSLTSSLLALDLSSTPVEDESRSSTNQKPVDQKHRLPVARSPGQHPSLPLHTKSSSKQANKRMASQSVLSQSLKSVKNEDKGKREHGRNKGKKNKRSKLVR